MKITSKEKINPDDPFTPQEFQCYHYLLKGYSHKEIMYEMGLSARSVEVLCTFVYVKKRVTSHVKLLAQALSETIEHFSLKEVQTQIQDETKYSKEKYETITESSQQIPPRSSFWPTEVREN